MCLIHSASGLIQSEFTPSVPEDYTWSMDAWKHHNKSHWRLYLDDDDDDDDDDECPISIFNFMFLN